MQHHFGKCILATKYWYDLVCIFAAKDVVKVETPATFDDAVMRELLSRRVRTASRAQLAARDLKLRSDVTLIIFSDFGTRLER